MEKTFSGASSVDDVDTSGWPKALVEGASTWPNITEQREALEGADDAAKEENKLEQLDPRGGQ